MEDILAIETDECQHKSSDEEEAGLKLELFLAQRADRAQRMNRVTSGLVVYDGRHKEDTAEDIMDTLTKNTDGTCQAPSQPTEEEWSLSDLFIRQYLNNLADGFGMYNVEEMYIYLRSIKHKLIEFGMISKDWFDK